MQVLDRRKALSITPLFRLAFRPFFLGACLLAVLAIALWLLALGGAIGAAGYWLWPQWQSLQQQNATLAQNQQRLTEQSQQLQDSSNQLQQQLLAEQQQKLAQLEQSLQQQQQQLLGAKTEQQQAVGRLQAMLKQQGRQLDYLRQNEASLQSKLEELRRLAQQARELAGLTKNKGKLTWPLQGSLLQRFGESRQGGISSRGILIQSTEGQAVKAVADGQVIYADWLKGYGWVIVLDHGAGFMSLYGHNQNLLKKPGTRINAGETIALAGTSGGQSSAGLYFEIRNKGEAVNPLQWLSRN